MFYCLFRLGLNHSSLRLYPALPYMERVSTKADIIPLRFPAQLNDGNQTREIIIEPGQVLSLSYLWEILLKI
jgi:hypothetical protein